MNKSSSRRRLLPVPDALDIRDGVVVDRASGVLLRLDLQSAQAPFALQRRLLRVDAAPR